VAAEFLRGVFSASGALSKNPSSPGVYDCNGAARFKREREGGRIRLDRKEREALAACWRRACVEFGIPAADDSAEFGNRPGYADLDEYESGNGCRNRRRGVHGDAQWAVIGGGGIGMEVRDLDDSQQRQQDETQNRYRRQSG
jgi:hypothetical protein